MHRLLLSLLVLPLAACRTNFVRLAFDPSLYEAELVHEGQTPFARILVAVPAAMRELPDGTEGPFLQVLVRVENRGDEEILIDPARASLVDADLVDFGTPLPDFAPPGRVGPGETRSFALHFLYPEGMVFGGADPRALNVRLVFEVPGGIAEATASFERAYPRYVDYAYPGYAPYYYGWYPPFYWTGAIYCD